MVVSLVFFWVNGRTQWMRAVVVIVAVFADSRLYEREEVGSQPRSLGRLKRASTIVVFGRKLFGRE